MHRHIIFLCIFIAVLKSIVSVRQNTFSPCPEYFHKHSIRSLYVVNHSLYIYEKNSLKPHMYNFNTGYFGFSSQDHHLTLSDETILDDVHSVIYLSSSSVTIQGFETDLLLFASYNRSQVFELRNGVFVANGSLMHIALVQSLIKLATQSNVIYSVDNSHLVLLRLQLLNPGHQTLRTLSIAYSSLVNLNLGHSQWNHLAVLPFDDPKPFLVVFPILSDRTEHIAYGVVQQDQVYTFRTPFGTNFESLETARISKRPLEDMFHCAAQWVDERTSNQVGVIILVVYFGVLALLCACMCQRKHLAMFKKPNWN